MTFEEALKSVCEAKKNAVSNQKALREYAREKGDETFEGKFYGYSVKHDYWSTETFKRMCNALRYEIEYAVNKVNDGTHELEVFSNRGGGVTIKCSRIGI